MWMEFINLWNPTDKISKWFVISRYNRAELGIARIISIWLLQTIDLVAASDSDSAFYIIRLRRTHWYLALDWMITSQHTMLMSGFAGPIDSWLAIARHKRGWYLEILRMKAVPRYINQLHSHTFTQINLHLYIFLKLNMYHHPRIRTRDGR